MIELLKLMLDDMMKALMLRDIDKFIMCVGPGEFHFVQPNEMEFKCLCGKEKVTRTQLPEQFADGNWIIIPANSLDEVLDIYNSVVINSEKINLFDLNPN